MFIVLNPKLMKMILMNMASNSNEHTNLTLIHNMKSLWCTFHFWSRRIYVNTIWGFNAVAWNKSLLSYIGTKVNHLIEFESTSTECTYKILYFSLNFKNDYSIETIKRSIDNINYFRVYTSNYIHILLYSVISIFILHIKLFSILVLEG